MSKVIFLIGCSASGKTTWAKQQHGFEIVCRDDIRQKLMTDSGQEFSWDKWDWKRESEVSKIHRQQIDDHISARKNVIVADTNLNRDQVRELEKPFDAAGYIVEYKKMDVDFQTLLKRDLHRGSFAVGTKVIAQQWEKLKKNWPSQNEKRLREMLKTQGEPCFICDIDGTIANHDGIRGHYELENVSKDHIVLPVREIVRSLLNSNHKCVFVSGREGTDQCKNDTKAWIQKLVGAGDWMLLMRHAGDSRRDDIVKLELLETLMSDPFNLRPEFAIDDRGRCIRAWRSVGLFTLQVGNPYIEF